MANLRVVTGLSSTSSADFADVEITYTCAICHESLPASSPLLLKGTISRTGTVAFQELFFHRNCLVSVLDPRVPLGEVFEPPIGSA